MDVSRDPRWCTKWPREQRSSHSPPWLRNPPDLGPPIGVFHGHGGFLEPLKGGNPNHRKTIGKPQDRWFIRENSIRKWSLVVPLFMETSNEMWLVALRTQSSLQWVISSSFSISQADRCLNVPLDWCLLQFAILPFPVILANMMCLWLYWRFLRWPSQCAGNPTTPMPFSMIFANRDERLW